MLKKIEQALQQADDLAKTHSSAVVMFSGGKDSIAVHQIVKDLFEKKTYVYMEPFPGLKCIEDDCKRFEDFLGQKVHRTLHWSTIHYIHEEFWSFPSEKRRSINTISNLDNMIAMKAMFNASLVITGAKRSDQLSLTYRHSLKSMAKRGDIFMPLLEWKNSHVVNFLHSMRLRSSPIGDMTNDANLTYEYILRLFDFAREDFLIVERSFPFIRTCVKHREIYGQKSKS